MKPNIDKRALANRLRDVNCLPLDYRDSAEIRRGELRSRWRASESNAAKKSILVPLDCTPFAEHALPIAIQIARHSGANIRLVHMYAPVESIHDPYSLHFASSFDAYAKREQSDYLCNLARRIEKSFSVRVKSTVIEANDVGESLSYVGNVGADLVVMATHGRGRLGNWLWESMTNKLTNRAMVPHLFVRGHNSPADLTKTISIRNILIPLDGSKAAESVLAPTAAFAASINSSRTLLRVVKTGNVWSARPNRSERQIAWPDSDYAAASHYLETIAKSLRGYERTIRTRTVRQEKSVAASILAQSRILDVDVIALASRARGPLARLLRPSMVERLLHKGSVPVLMCPQLD